MEGDGTVYKSTVVTLILEYFEVVLLVLTVVGGALFSLTHSGLPCAALPVLLLYLRQLLVLYGGV